MTENVTIARVGLHGVLVTFGDRLTDQANRSAVAFRKVIDAQNWPEVEETVSTLVSTYMAVDLVAVPYDDIAARVGGILASRDWRTEAPPAGRKLWTLPMCFEPEVAPQIVDAAHIAGVTLKEAQTELSNARTRVITLGFAPGQPYLGLLDETWDIPRQSDLTPQVPIGALVVAIRQFVLFAASAPTGWRHVGQTSFRPFDPDRATPVAFTPGDEVRFASVSSRELKELVAGNTLGGAEWTILP